MFRNFRITSLFLACVVLAGCAGRVWRETPDAPTRRITSAQVVWVEATSIPLTVSRSSYGSYAAPTISAGTVNQSRTEVGELMAETRKQMASQIETALLNSGAARGDDAQIRLQFVGTSHNGMGPSAALLMSVYFKDSPPGTKPWTVRVAAGTSMVDDVKSVANKIAKAAVEELIAAGIVKPKS